MLQGISPMQGDKVKTDGGTSRTDVVLGDDWVGPGDAVEIEVRDSRAKRGFLSISSSPLARKIVLFNLVALVILVGSVLFTNPFRDSLLRQQEDTLGQTAQIVADIVAATGGTVNAGEALMQRLSLDSRFELVILSTNGAIVARKQGLQQDEQGDLFDRSTPISDFLARVWSGMRLITGARLVEEPPPISTRSWRACSMMREMACVQAIHIVVCPTRCGLLPARLCFGLAKSKGQLFCAAMPRTLLP